MKFDNIFYIFDFQTSSEWYVKENYMLKYLAFKYWLRIFGGNVGDIASTNCEWSIISYYRIHDTTIDFNDDGCDIWRENSEIKFMVYIFENTNKGRHMIYYYIITINF